MTPTPARMQPHLLYGRAGGRQLSLRGCARRMPRLGLLSPLPLRCNIRLCRGGLALGVFTRSALLHTAVVVSGVLHQRDSYPAEDAGLCTSRQIVMLPTSSDGTPPFPPVPRPVKQTSSSSRQHVRSHLAHKDLGCSELLSCGLVAPPLLLGCP